MIIFFKMTSANLDWPNLCNFGLYAYHEDEHFYEDTMICCSIYCIFYSKEFYSFTNLKAGAAPG